MTGLSFWATGYCVSTVGLDEEIIRKYIRDQNNRDNWYSSPLGGFSWDNALFERASSNQALWVWLVILLIYQKYFLNF